LYIVRWNELMAPLAARASYMAKCWTSMSGSGYFAEREEIAEQ
jgi:hypothetical protein